MVLHTRSAVGRFIFFGMMIFPQLALAMGMDDFEMNHFISVGAGIATPSLSSSMGENAAGLQYNQEFKFVGEGALTNNNTGSIGLGGLFLLGNGFVGGGAGIRTFNGQGNNGGSITFLDFGMGAKIDAINLAFGATGTYTLQQNGPTTGTGSGASLNTDVGFLINPNGIFRGGLTGYQLLSPTPTVGAGMAIDFSDWSTFAVDSTMDIHANGLVVKPGFGIHLMDFQLAIGYGICLDTTGYNWIRQGGSIALGIRIAYNFHLQMYYNQLALYYLGLAVRI
jgi:hypothetical protein